MQINLPAIDDLKSQNQSLKRQLQYWKRKYQQLHTSSVLSDPLFTLPYLTQKQIQQQHQNNHLIHCCFILQQPINNHKESLRYVFPSTYPKAILQMVSKYAFLPTHPTELIDDPNHSRKIQICFDTNLYQEVKYCFEGQTFQKNKFQIDTGLLKKKYVFGIIKTELYRQQSKYYQTQVFYGFVSTVPFRNCFTEILRILLQQSKLSMIYTPQVTDYQSKQRRISAMIPLLQINFSVVEYPISFQLGTGYNNLRVLYTTPGLFHHSQSFRLSRVLRHYSPYKISKIVHYLLAEQSMVVTCRTRRSLNMLMEGIEIMLRPFHWLFATIYSYCPAFQPFLSSPLPVLIGRTTHFPLKHPLVDIFPQEEEAVDQQLHDKYYEDIAQLANRISSKKTIKLEQGGYVIEVSEGGYRLQQYVKGLLQNTLKKANKSQFQNAFLSSQLLSHYKQSVGDIHIRDINMGDINIGDMGNKQ